MKLEFGCGDSPKKADEGYLGVDIRKLDTVHYVCSAWEIDSHVQPNTVDAIFSRHFLEHLTWQQSKKTLQVWFNIMKTGGELEIIVPDIEFHIEQLLMPNRKDKNDKGISNLKLGLKGLWGGQRGTLEDTWDIHKSGYDFNILYDMLLEVGFVSIHRVNSTPKSQKLLMNRKHLWVKAKK